MAQVTLKGNPLNTKGSLPAVGQTAPDFSMVKLDLSESKLSELPSGKKVLNLFPSIDTGTCAASVRRFNQEAAKLEGVSVLNLSKDLPFAQKRFCGDEGIESSLTASVFRSDFSEKYPIEFTDGPLKALLSRSVLVLDENNVVLYAEQVGETADEPNYEAALAVLK